MLRVRPIHFTSATKSRLPGGLSLDPLIRIAELGMDVCALRSGSQKGSRVQQTDELAGASLMPGFIHSSPAMTKLVEEVHKIRSSDVTVLVTGRIRHRKRAGRACHSRAFFASLESVRAFQLHCGPEGTF